MSVGAKVDGHRYRQIQTDVDVDIDDTDLDYIDIWGIYSLM